ncbi:MAG: mannose-1-phosphate guanylyltransferase/mannose-6-phosphate isomerase [Bacteriovoracaceae bacterium]|nr:mannose-1-phosphate guanylyltransferase/mannose-6-phosphate isomerase [Bacteriovoracaceae bacterium]
MTSNKIKHLVLCGGSGKRLWPLSRTLYPKQFLKIFKGESLFTQTIFRNMGICQEALITLHESQYFLAQEEIKRSNYKNPTHFILEPIGKNTAPAIILGALSSHPQDIIMVTPADHFIENSESYLQAIKRSIELAQSDFIVTLGIKPTYAETGFGYIESKGEEVLSFKEKPELNIAQEYLKQGTFYWNSGMFCFKVATFLQEIKTFAPDLFKACETVWEKSLTENNITRLNKNDMEKIPSISIDYALMEKTKKIKMVPVNFAWSDVGSFDAIEKIQKKDEQGNSALLPFYNIASSNNLVLQEGKRTIALSHVDDLIVVDTQDALLITKKGYSQDVKKVTELIEKKEAHLTEVHCTAHRPWGTYTVLEDTPSYKIKRIVVYPSGRLSLQKHSKRSEHWTVVEGVAKVTIDGHIQFLKRNESTYIPIEAVHRLENEGLENLVMIETQVGSYLGEDDIVRLEDQYKRH